MVIPRIRSSMAILTIVGISVLNPSLRCLGAEAGQSQLRFEEITKQFPHSKLLIGPNRLPSDVLPKSPTIKKFSINVIETDKDGMNMRYVKMQLSKADVCKFYSFISDGVSVINEKELIVIAYITIQPSSGEKIRGIILHSNVEPVLYTFKKEGDDEWAYFATNRSEAQVRAFLTKMKK
jgi:hypothetical protein